MGIVNKYLNKVKIVKPWDSIICEIPILTQRHIMMILPGLMDEREKIEGLLHLWLLNKSRSCER